MRLDDITEAIAMSERFTNLYRNHIGSRPALVPTASGRVQLEWHRGVSSLEIEFDPHR